MARTISIHQGLAELKLIEKRLFKASNFKSIGLKQKKADKVLDTNLTEEEFNQQALSKFASVKDLIELWQEIKEKIVMSNATTKATVAGKEMTIAEIIEYKNTIKNKKELLNNLKSAYTGAIREKEYRNREIESRLDNRYSKFETKNDELVSKLRKEDEEKEFFNIVDPLDLSKVIEDLEKEIDDFESEVDFVLSRSNAITEIEISK